MCHGLRGHARRGRGLELEVLDELGRAGILFPFLRPGDQLIDEFAWRVAAGFDLPRMATGEEMAEGVALLPIDERRRIVRSWAARYPQVWRSICRKVGDSELAEHTLVSSSVRGAIHDRVGPHPALLEQLESELFEWNPAAAVAFVIESDTVWLHEEAVWGPPTITKAHVTRTRTQVRRLATRLPFDGLPGASAVLQRGCELAASPEVERVITGLLLDKYRFLLNGPPSYIRSRN